VAPCVSRCRPSLLIRLLVSSRNSLLTALAMLWPKGGGCWRHCWSVLPYSWRASRLRSAERRSRNG